MITLKISFLMDSSEGCSIKLQNINEEEEFQLRDSLRKAFLNGDCYLVQDRVTKTSLAVNTNKVEAYSIDRFEIPVS